MGSGLIAMMTVGKILAVGQVLAFEAEEGEEIRVS